jgi:hypothetical protein
VTFIPQYRRHVVTASVDSSDIWGCTDLAIGWFRDAQERSAAIRRVIRRWWGFHWREHQQLRWAEFLSAGEVSSEEAERWCFKRWPSEW